MTIEDYQKNLRGVNDGVDFSPEFLVCSLPAIALFELMDAL